MSLPKLKIDEIHVRIIPDEELVTLNFMVGDHFHTMRRDSKESMKKALIRFTKTVDKTIDKNNAWEKKKLAKANKNDNHHSKSSNHSNHYNSSNEIDDHTNVNHKSNDNRHDNSADNSTIHKNYDVYSVEKALEVSNRVYNTLDAETSEITDNKDNKVVKIFKDNIPIDISNKTNSDYEDNTILVYGSIHYKIQINPPAVTTLKVHPNHTVLVGCPIVPTVTTEFANDVNYQWCRETAPNSDEYIPVSTDEIYFPQDDAVNCKIKLYATAIRSDDTATANSTVYGRATVLYVTDMIHPSVPCLNRMLQVRSNYISIKKHLQQNDQQLEKSFRVTTYNILAEPFATSDNSINHIFSYVNSSYLDTNYRIQRIQAEIISYESDILCLQECDHKLFDGYYLPLLKQQYYGYHTNKSSSVLEGCATFISTKSFRVITKFELALKDILRSSTELQRIYEYRPDLKTILGRKVGTIVQITICQSKYDSSQIVVVANSHLYYHPAADLVRYIQMHTIVRIVSDIMSTISMEGIPALSTMKIPGMMSPTVPCTDFQTTDELKVSAIFLGDLNSSLGSAAVEYLER